MVDLTTKQKGISDENIPSKELFYFISKHIFSFIKFFNDDLDDNDPENYYMEREWRKIGYVKFTLKDVKRIFIPKNYETSLSKDLPHYKGDISLLDQ